MKRGTRLIAGGALLGSAFVVICLLAFFAVGCSSQVELDQSLLTDDPCAAPCWHNIVPGVSTEDDVRHELQGSRLVRKSSLEYDLTEQGGLPLGVFYWKAREREFNRIYLKDGKVLKIRINVEYALTLGDIVDKYGPPEGVYAHLGGTEYWEYLVLLYYPAQGLSITSYASRVDPEQYEVRRGIGILSEDLRVTRVVYFEPTSLGEMMHNVFLLSDDLADYHLANAREWPGFGDIKLAD